MLLIIGASRLCASERQKGAIDHWRGAVEVRLVFTGKEKSQSQEKDHWEFSVHPSQFPPERIELPPVPNLTLTPK